MSGSGSGHLGATSRVFLETLGPTLGLVNASDFSVIWVRRGWVLVGLESLVVSCDLPSRDNLVVSWAGGWSVSCSPSFP